MKIAYVIHWNEGPRSGVFKKVVHQVSEWTRLGHRVALFLFTRATGEYWERALEGVEVRVQCYDGALSRLRDFKRLADQVLGWSPDVIYHRYDQYYFGLPRLLRRVPSVLEVNSNDLTEMRMESGSLKYLYHKYTRRRILQAADGAVFVSRELSGEPGFSRYVKKQVVIGNGINLEEFLVSRSMTAVSEGCIEELNESKEQLKESTQSQVGSGLGTGLGADQWAAVSSKSQAGEPLGPTSAGVLVLEQTVDSESEQDSPPNSLPNPVESASNPVESLRSISAEPVRFVFIGSSGQAWHGVDLIADLAARRPAWKFDVIGLTNDELEGPVPANMSFHGPLTRAEYQPHLDQADIALGTMALFRKRMAEASPLKVREYLANGLPVIIAYEETDFPEPVPFLLKLPNQPDSLVLHLGRIEEFASRWRGSRVPRKEITRLDVKTKESERLKFMKSVIREKGDGR
ncbi:glycosyltransferase [Paenibacillus tuaregi]|uniref:glycosyltransferase n=1 Tax=Paenibacillus tuaregi TaxID=1816681 RepID=UPI000837DCF7|nr:glycosyltransferase [Paenibacillus tuaregi]